MPGEGSESTSLTRRSTARRGYRAFARHDLEWIAADSHPQRAPIHIQQRFLLFHIPSLLPAHANELAQHLHIEPSRFRLGIDVANVAAQRLALLLESLDSVHNAAQAVRRD